MFSIWKHITCAVYEGTFSTMKQVKFKNRNLMAHEKLGDSLRVAPLTLVMKER